MRARPIRKTGHELPVEPPFPFRPTSNGEVAPRAATARDQRALRVFRELVEDRHARAGMTRRQFAESACGLATALFVVNQVYGCSSSDKNANGAGAGGAGGANAGGSGGASGGASGAGGAGSTNMVGSTGGGAPSAGMSAAGSGGAGGANAGGANAGGSGAAGFNVPDDMMDDIELACDALLEPDQFILDVQTHTQSPLAEAWTGRELPSTATAYVNTIFAGSDTSVAVLSGIPSARNLGLPNVAARTLFEEVVAELAGPRLIHHANVRPDNGPSELDYMEEVFATYAPGAWKVYPHDGAWRLDSEEVGMPFIEQARSLGLPLIAAHRGLADNGDYGAPSSPVDLGNAAAQYPDVNFLCYHSGYESGTDEAHPFDPDDDNPRGVDRLVKAMLDNDLPPNGNVYAELGTTWNSVMRSPDEAAHLLGKLLLYVGEDRVVWGTDCVFHGSPQAQIAALRVFEIPQQMQDDFGYPALTDARRAKIFGLNAAPIYGVDPAARRCTIEEDAFAQLRRSYIDDPRSVPIPRDTRFGPRTRREFLAFRRFEGFFELG